MEVRERSTALPGLQDIPWTPARETVLRASKLISPKVGLIRRLRTVKRRAQDPTLITVIAEPADVSRYSEFPGLSNGGGTAETLDGAMAAAIGECVERYCLFFGEKVMPRAVRFADVSGQLEEHQMVLATYKQVQEHALAPKSTRLFSRQQIEALPKDIPIEYFDENTPIRWIWAYSLTHGRPRLVPVARVFYTQYPGEASIGLTNTTGMGAGASLEEAIHSGLLEVVERDAVIMSWLHRRVGRRLEIDSPTVQEHLNRCFLADRPDVDLRLYDLQVDVPIPVVMSMLQRPTESGPFFSISAAARLDPEAAVRKALREQAQNFPLFRQLIRTSWQPAPDFSNVSDFERHLLLYLRRPEMIREELAFCDEAPTVNLSEVPNRSTGRVLGDLEFCVDALASRGFETLVVDLTTPDVAEAGFRVVRVVIPGMAILHGGPMPYLGPSRVYEEPSSLVWEGSGWDPANGLNPTPHPFA